MARWDVFFLMNAFVPSDRRLPWNYFVPNRYNRDVTWIRGHHQPTIWAPGTLKLHTTQTLQLVLSYLNDVLGMSFYGRFVYSRLTSIRHSKALFTHLHRLHLNIFSPLQQLSHSWQGPRHTHCRLKTHKGVLGPESGGTKVYCAERADGWSDVKCGADLSSLAAQYGGRAECLRTISKIEPRCVHIHAHTSTRKPTRNLLPGGLCTINSCSLFTAAFATQQLKKNNVSPPLTRSRSELFWFHFLPHRQKNHVINSKAQRLMLW